MQKRKSVEVKKREHTVVFNAQGKLVFMESGNEATYSVSFTKEQYAMMNNCVLTHNHPRGYIYPIGDMRRIGNSFSLDDMITAPRGNLAEMHALTEYYDFVIKRPTTGWLSVEETKKLFVSIEKQVSSELNLLLVNNITTEKKVATIYYHKIMRMFAEKICAEYGKKRRFNPKK